MQTTPTHAVRDTTGEAVGMALAAGRPRVLHRAVREIRVEARDILGNRD
ncbi:hypothetical protein [Streptomyces sp. B1I3]|nr:hypothetical protein [Streptomyces sp. B1I3]